MTISLTRSLPSRLSQRRGILNDRPLSGTRVLWPARRLVRSIGRQWPRCGGGSWSRGSRVGPPSPQAPGPRCAPAAVRAPSARCAVTRDTRDSAPTTTARLYCRLCDSDRLLSVLDLGATPPCEKFLTPGELDLPEPTFPLHLRLCEDCLLLQIPALITPEDTFTEYPYFSSFSDTWVQHAKTFVRDTIKRLGLSTESFMVEVASNDGYLLQHVVAAGIPCLGSEPSVNVGVTARERGVPTVTDFLDEPLARRVREEYGPADLVV